MCVVNRLRLTFPDCALPATVFEVVEAGRARILGNDILVCFHSGPSTAAYVRLEPEGRRRSPDAPLRAYVDWDGGTTELFSEDHDCAVPVDVVADYGRALVAAVGFARRMDGHTWEWVKAHAEACETLDMSAC